ncbi:MAG: 4Fe-4S binding protein [Candidatus Heimdallarchaeota archaeon]|nr:4Fe-4S binding protein [Candidatus Heimdallarchaeota archaeon]
MGRPLWIVQLIKQTFTGRFTLAKLTHVAPLRWVIDRILFHEDKIYYLPKTTTISVNKTLEPKQDTVLPTKVIEHFIDNSSKLWIMNSCICRSSNKCKDHDQNIGCLFLGEAVLNINPALGRLVSKDEAKDHLQRGADNGLVNLIGRNKLDVMWLGATPGDQLMTICHCCSCCCLWRMIPQLDRQISDKVTKLPGVEVLVNEELCTGCGKCAEPEICFVNAISIHQKKSYISQDCRGCGRCLEVCPRKAISLTIDMNFSVKKAIDDLSPLVDVS